MYNAYVLITPARNEEACIEKTIESIISQTVLPKKWVIVSDGTDNTDEIVNLYAAKYDWIELLRGPDNTDRDFGAMAVCVNAGYETVKKLSFDIIGKVDADISFERDYFDFLLKNFSENPRLGIIGTYYIEDTYDFSKKRHVDEEYVPGMCPMFRREVFEEIGGLPTVEHGECVITVALAQMRGWQTRGYAEKKFIHHRKAGTCGHNIVHARFKYGYWDYYVGNHPLWELFRGFYQMTVKPYVLGGVMILSGYVWAWLSKVKRPVSAEVIDHIRQRQLRRLKFSLCRSMKQYKSKASLF